MHQIYTYDVELKLTQPHGARLVTRHEYAYSAMEACMQASIAQSADPSTDGAVVSIVRVSPPAADIERVAKAFLDQCATRVGTLLRGENVGQ